MSQAQPRAGKAPAKSSPAAEAIGQLLKNLNHSLRQAVEEALRGGGIEMSLAHLATLYALANEPGAAGAQLARSVCVTAQTMNTILRRLETDGAIERQPNPANARADSWNVTRFGQARLDKAKSVAAVVWSRMLSTMSTREVTQFRELLERCISGLEATRGSASVVRAAAGRRGAVVTKRPRAVQRVSVGQR